MVGLCLGTPLRRLVSDLPQVGRLNALFALSTVAARTLFEAQRARIEAACRTAIDKKFGGSISVEQYDRIPNNRSKALERKPKRRYIEERGRWQSDRRRSGLLFAG